MAQVLPTYPTGWIFIKGKTHVADLVEEKMNNIKKLFDPFHNSLSIRVPRWKLNENSFEIHIGWIFGMNEMLGKGEYVICNP